MEVEQNYQSDTDKSDSDGSKKRVDGIVFSAASYDEEEKKKKIRWPRWKTARLQGFRFAKSSSWGENMANIIV